GGQPGREELVREAGREAARDGGDQARSRERACRRRAARAVTEVLARDEHVAGGEAGHQRRVEIREEPARRIDGRERREAERQDVRGAESVREGPGAPGEDGQAQLARRGVHGRTTPNAQRGPGRTVTSRPGWRRITRAS